MKTIDTLQNNTKRVREAVSFGLQARRALSSAASDIIASQIAQARTHPELNRYVDMAQGGTSVLWVAGQIGRVGLDVGREKAIRHLPMIPLVGRSVASAALTKAHVYEPVPRTPEQRFQFSLHALEGGMQSAGRYLQASMEEELAKAAAESVEAQDPPMLSDAEEAVIKAKERQAEIIKRHTDPMVAMCKGWISFTDVETELPHYEQVSGTMRINDAVGVLEKGGVRSDYGQLVVIALHQNFLEEGRDLGESSDLAPYRTQGIDIDPTVM